MIDLKLNPQRHLPCREWPLFLLSYDSFIIEVDAFPLDCTSTWWVRYDITLHDLRGECNRTGHNLCISFESDGDLETIWRKDSVLDNAAEPARASRRDCYCWQPSEPSREGPLWAGRCSSDREDAAMKYREYSEGVNKRRQLTQKEGELHSSPSEI